MGASLRSFASRTPRLANEAYATRHNESSARPLPVHHAPSEARQPLTWLVAALAQVTFLMGRLAGGKHSECQAVLFESKHMSDLDAARWFARNAHRFEQTRERIAREKQHAGSRAATSEGRSRSDSIKSQ